MTRLRVLLLILYVVLIFFLSSRPYLHPPGPDFRLKDKVAHLAEYTGLGLLLFSGLGWMIRRPRFTAFWILFAVGATVAAVDEVVQGFIPGRLSDPTDWLADVIGVSLGVLLAMLVVKLRDSREAGGNA
jgi:VanZ family protein